MVIGLSKDGKWVFNKACTKPWCRASVHFEVKMSCFPAAFQDHCRNHGGTSGKASGLSSTVISHALRKFKTQLGPSSSLDYRAVFTLSRFYTTF